MMKKQMMKETIQQLNQKRHLRQAMSSHQIAAVLTEAAGVQALVAVQKEELDEKGCYTKLVTGCVVREDYLGVWVDQEKVHFDEIRWVTII